MITFLIDMLDLPNFSHMTTILMHNVMLGPNLTIQVNGILIRLKQESLAIMAEIKLLFFK